MPSDVQQSGGAAAGWQERTKWHGSVARAKTSLHGNVPGRNCLTRTKQCEVVLKIRTDTLQGTGGKRYIKQEKMQQHTTYCIMGNSVVMSEAYRKFKFKRKSRLS